MESLGRDLHRPSFQGEAQVDVVFHSMGMPFNGDTIKTGSLGGSETSAYYLARGLAALGHRVTMFTGTEKEGVYDGVTYCNYGEPSQAFPLGQRFHFYAEHTPHDVTYIQRHPQAFMRRFASKLNIWALHDLALHRTAGQVQQNLKLVDRVTTVSEFHAKQVQEVYGINPTAMRVVHNGVDLALYGKAKADEWPVFPVQRLSRKGKPKKEMLQHGDDLVEVIDLPRQSFVMLYQSRPERGMEHLVRPGGIMERLAERPDIQLVIVGYDNTHPQMSAYYQMLNAWAGKLPNVTILGAFDKPRLAALQQECDLLIYPTEFGEVSCITAMEAMAAGLPMLTSECAVLPETCADTGTILLPLKDDKADEDAFVQNVLSLYDNLCDEAREEASEIARLSEEQRHVAHRYLWSRAVSELDDLIREAFAAKSDGAVARHCIEHSDINFLRWYLERAGVIPDVVTERTVEELNTLYDFTTSPEKYKAHYDFHQAVYYDLVGDTPTDVGTVDRSTRFQGVGGAIESAILRITGSGLRSKVRVLDYGCAHGHYAIPLAKLFPDHYFFGVDINDRAIDTAKRWATRDGVANVEFLHGTIDDVAGVYDIIYAGEVLEHVPDYLGMLEKLRARLASHGTLVVTTPMGRWEWVGTEPFKTGRQHLHHFERNDILDICAGMSPVLQYAPASSPEVSGGFLGSWVWSVMPGDKPFQPIDYERKLAAIRPRQTIGACLIVKDGEESLYKCISSIVDWVDEVVICIDPTTTDDTRTTIERLKQRNPWTPIRVFTLERPVLESGFATARNFSIDQTDCDWVLWMDADEVALHPERYWVLLREGCFNAWSTPQIHYSTEPAQVLTTDYPCRVFRNHNGVQFYGTVHEHPEDKPGHSINHAMIEPAIQYLHNGYVDEQVRRKRYQRNLPLLMRDLQENPDRKLNKYLHLRDIAQGIGFELEQTGGQKLQGHDERAQQGIAIFEELLEGQHLKMCIDSLQYYSHCVAVLGKGFEADIKFSTRTEAAPDLAMTSEIKARFLSRAHFQKLLARISEESTKHYESQYL